MRAKRRKRSPCVCCSRRTWAPTTTAGHHVISRAAMFVSQVIVYAMLLAVIPFTPTLADVDNNLDDSADLNALPHLPLSSLAVANEMARSWGSMVDRYRQSSKSSLFPEDLMRVMHDHSEDQVLRDLSETSQEPGEVHPDGKAVLALLESRLAEVKPEDGDIWMKPDQESLWWGEGGHRRHPRDVRVKRSRYSATAGGGSNPSFTSERRVHTGDITQHDLSGVYEDISKGHFQVDTPPPPFLDVVTPSGPPEQESTGWVVEPASPRVEVVQLVPHIPQPEPTMEDRAANADGGTDSDSAEDSGKNMVRIMKIATKLDKEQVDQFMGEVDHKDQFPGMTRMILKYPIQTTSVEEPASGDSRDTLKNSDFELMPLQDTGHGLPPEQVDGRLARGLRNDTTTTPTPQDTTQLGVTSSHDSSFASIETVESESTSLETNDEAEPIMDPLDEHFDAVEEEPIVLDSQAGERFAVVVENYNATGPTNGTSGPSETSQSAGVDSAHKDTTVRNLSDVTIDTTEENTTSELKNASKSFDHQEETGKKFSPPQSERNRATVGVEGSKPKSLLQEPGKTLHPNEEHAEDSPNRQAATRSVSSIHFPTDFFSQEPLDQESRLKNDKRNVASSQPAEDLQKGQGHAISPPDTYSKSVTADANKSIIQTKGTHCAVAGKKKRRRRKKKLPTVPQNKASSELNPQYVLQEDKTHTVYKNVPESDIFAVELPRTPAETFEETVTVHPPPTPELIPLKSNKEVNIAVLKTREETVLPVQHENAQDSSAGNESQQVSVNTPTTHPSPSLLPSDSNKPCKRKKKKKVTINMESSEKTLETTTTAAPVLYIPGVNHSPSEEIIVIAPPEGTASQEIALKQEVSSHLNPVETVPDSTSPIATGNINTQYILPEIIDTTDKFTNPSSDLPPIEDLVQAIEESVKASHENTQKTSFVKTKHVPLPTTTEPFPVDANWADLQDLGFVPTEFTPGPTCPATETTPSSYLGVAENTLISSEPETAATIVTLPVEAAPGEGNDGTTTAPKKKKKKKKGFKNPFLVTTTTAAPWPYSVVSLAPFINLPSILSDFSLPTPAPKVPKKMTIKTKTRTPTVVMPSLSPLWDSSRLLRPYSKDTLPADACEPSPVPYEQLTNPYVLPTGIYSYDIPTLPSLRTRPLLTWGQPMMYSSPWGIRRRRSVEEDAEVGVLGPAGSGAGTLADQEDQPLPAQDVDAEDLERAGRSPADERRALAGAGFLPVNPYRLPVGPMVKVPTLPPLPPALEELIPRRQETEVEKAEREQKTVQRLIQLVNVVGSLQSFLSDRAKTIVRRLNKIVDEDDGDDKKRTRRDLGTPLSSNAVLRNR